MRKYIMRQIPPEFEDFAIYFDDEGLMPISGECNAVYINDGRNYTRGYNGDEYSSYYKQLSGLIEDYDNQIYDTVEELFEDCASDIPKEKYGKLAELIDCCYHYGITNYQIAEFLEIKTGKLWNVKMFHGYSQGDYCEVVYCSDVYSAEEIKEIGKMYLGCGSEFECIDCDENGEPTDEICCGYFATDDIVWTEDERLVKHFAEYFGCQPDEIEVQLFDGYIRTAKYKTVGV